MSFRIFQFTFGDGYAGSAKIAIQSSELLAGRGHNVTLFVSRNSLSERRAREKNLNVVSLNDKLEFKTLIKSIVPHFENVKPNFVISHHSLDRKVGFKLKSIYRNKFVNIGYRHNITKSFPVIGPLMYNHYYDYLIACSRGVADSLISSGIRKKKVKVIYNGIDVPENVNEITGDSIKEKYSLNDKIVLGLSTWFHKERKGFDILFNAFSKLNNNFIFLLVGIPQENQNAVYDYANQFGITKEKIFMPGYVENIWEYYKAMDIFLLPSRSEGFSLALLEAAAAKLPIVASNIPGTNEFIINNENGFLFDVENYNELVNKINNLSNNENLKKKFSDTAYELVINKFQMKNYIENLESFLSKLK